jgi:tRNA-dihydrouridine synthase C
VAEAVSVPVFANGEVWTLDDYLRCREISGVADIMLGRGLVSRPDLARQIAAWRDGAEIREMPWQDVRVLLEDFWRQARRKLGPRYAPGRLKQWLGMLTRSYPEALALFAEVRRESDCELLDRLVLGHGLPACVAGSVGEEALCDLGA